ncbi:hypothetical protein TcCL_Unassigned04749, partial [Trypanosoma cruzi]
VSFLRLFLAGLCLHKWCHFYSLCRCVVCFEWGPGGGKLPGKSPATSVLPGQRLTLTGCPRKTPMAFFCSAPGGCLSLCTGAGVLFAFHFRAGRRLLRGRVRGSIATRDEGGGTGRTPCIDCPAISPYLDTGALGR